MDKSPILPLASASAAGTPRVVLFSVVVTALLAYWAGQLSEGQDPLAYLASATLILPLAYLVYLQRQQHAQVVAFSRQTSHDLDRYASIVHCAGAGIAFCNADGHLIECNEAFARLTGYDQDTLLRMSFRDITHPEDRDRENELFAAILHDERDDYRVEKRYIRADGQEVWVDLSVTVVRDGLRQPIRFVGVVFDITPQKKAETDLMRYRNAFVHAGEAMVITDRYNRILDVNRAFERISGYRLSDVKGRDPAMFASGQTPRDTYDQMWSALHEIGYWQGEVWDRRRNGEVYPKLLSIAVLRDARGEICNYVGSFSDMSAQKRAEARISYLSQHDVLTGLPNRFALHDRLQEALQSAKRSGQPLSVMLIDLDHFAELNDSLGHEAGDALLQEATRRLLSCMREGDIVARMGGDEFAIVAVGLNHPDSLQRLAEKIHGVLAPAYVVEGHSLLATPSIGVSVFPRDGDSVDALMRHADVALYHVKDNGRNGFQFFSEQMVEESSQRRWLAEELRHALPRGDFELHYQPQVHAMTGAVVGVEALLRWRHPTVGMIPPDRFIPVAESTAQIVDLGAWVIDRACAQLQAWRAQGIDGLRMAINLSAGQLGDALLVQRIGAAMDSYGLGEGDLEIEITESVAMENPEASILLLATLREIGVKVAIDDFGTGFSSLSYLRRLPIDTLKIDRSFVKDIEFDTNSAAICHSTINLAHILGLQTVAEGVETQGQRQFMQQAGCDVVQGYLYSRPLPASEFASWFAGNAASATVADERLAAGA